MENPTGKYRQLKAAEFRAAIDQVDAVHRDWLSDAPDEEIWGAAGKLIAGAVNDPSLALFTIATGPDDGMQKFVCQAAVRAFYQMLLSRAEAREMEVTDDKPRT